MPLDITPAPGRYPVPLGDGWTLVFLDCLGRGIDYAALIRDDEIMETWEGREARRLAWGRLSGGLMTMT